MLNPDRPIYPNAPLKLVTFQVRFPPVPELDELAPPKLLSDALRERYPILGGPPPVMQLDIGPGQTQQRPRGSRLMDRDRTKNVTLTGDSVALETSRYERYELFAEEIDWVLERVHAATPLPAVMRLGLRYIDEIQIEDVVSLSDWKQWINSDLIVGGVVDGYETLDYLAQMVLAIDELHRMTIRYGRVSQPVVDPNGVLRIDDSPTMPYFLLDIDSFWEPSRDGFKEFDAAEVTAVCLRLHEPIRDIFERAITPDLRSRFAEEATT
jgi:uncharacterized protein (TIGR04255 family)